MLTKIKIVTQITKNVSENLNRAVSLGQGKGGGKSRVNVGVVKGREEI